MVNKKEEVGANWYSIAGNSGIAFFTTLAGVSIAGVPVGQAWIAALIPAFIQGGLSACKELSLVGNQLGKQITSLMLLG